MIKIHISEKHKKAYFSHLGSTQCTLYEQRKTIRYLNEAKPHPMQGQ